MFPVFFDINIILFSNNRHNIFTRLAEGRAPTLSRVCRKVWYFMSTYEEFMILLTFALLVVAILNLSNKK